MYLKLKQMRNELGYTSQYMADKLKISKPFYSQIENGHRRLTYDMATKIAKIFKVKPDDLFYKDHINFLKNLKHN